MTRSVGFSRFSIHFMPLRYLRMIVLKTLLSILSIVVFTNSIAQLPIGISISPEDASGWDTLTLTLDASAACFINGTLVDSPSVFMHAGYTDQNCIQWNNLIAYDGIGEEGTTPELTSNGDSTFSIEFCPGTYFGLTPGTEIKAINAVFNNGSDWSSDARATGTEGNCVDFYIPLKTYSEEMFTELDFNIDVGFEYCIWGDYDNDGDLDLFVNRWGLSAIYRNNGDKTFTDIGVSFDSFAKGNWIDFDNDKDLDIILGSRFYENQGNDNFVEMIIDDLKGIDDTGYEIQGIGDYDNDGDDDVVYVYKNHTGILNNYDGTFLRVVKELKSYETVGELPAQFSDIDNDSDLDIVGDRVFINEGSNIFTLEQSYPGYYSAKYINTGDYDDDGDIDLVYYGSYSTILLENSNGSFSISDIHLNGNLKFCLFGDIDNNGHTDIVQGYAGYADLMLNNGANNYTTYTINHSLGSTNSASLGDYDNDGDLDIVICEDSKTRILENNINACVFQPSVPSNLTADVIYNTAFFNWDIGTDSRSPSASISYNICLINTDDNDSIIVPASDITTGELRNTKRGNTEKNSFWKTQGLKAGNYKWAVQSINNSLQSSPFSPFSIFQVTSGIDISPIGIEAVYPGNTATTLTLNESSPTDERLWLYGKNSGGPYEDTVSGITGTTYTPSFQIDGRYYITCQSIVGSDTIYSNDKLIKVLPFSENSIAAISSSQYDGTCTTGDYDKDGDLDLALIGDIGINIYKNTNNVFSKIGIFPSYFANGDIAFFDYNGDNFLDIIATGNSGSEKQTKIFINTGSDSFEELENDIIGLTHGSIEAGDYDNDGDPDILICGYSLEPITKIYRNEGDGVFIDLNLQIVQVMDGFATWGDVTNDGMLDFFLSGTDFSGNASAELYINSGNDSFEKSSYSFANHRFSFGGFGDYDNDGDLDILLGGKYSTDKTVCIYKNKGEGSFEEIVVSTDYRYNYVNWIDYNNNGLLDILLVRSEWYSDNIADYARRQFILKNSGNDSFDKIIFEDIITNIDRYQSIGDLDNDSDLDIFQISVDRWTNDRSSSLYKNQSILTKDSPDPPTNLSHERRGDDVIFYWEKPTSMEGEGISYDIAVGTNKDSIDIVAPLSDTLTGYRLVAKAGPIIDTSYQVTIKETGEYFWRVQSVNTSFMGS
ncbi:MAG: VCBS repeat-containing protein, partial [Bacteroidales bacterium]|nr:VCBS repeat-containing protein [Bacteroidales bacterium]